MSNSGDSDFFQKIFNQTLGHTLNIRNIRYLSGGCINNTVHLETDEAEFFLKWNDQEYEEMFNKESLGLELLRKNFPYNVPEVYGKGTVQSRSFLLLEFLEPGSVRPDYWTNLAIGLAQLHRVTHLQYGLDHDNHIGRLPQFNDWRSSWVDFFIEMRLEKQLELAVSNDYFDDIFLKKFRNIYSKLSQIFPDDRPALIHGDLWSGNLVVGPDGNCGLIDPAVYYGSREMEISFTRLFGGFDWEFYSAYQKEFPMESGFEERVPVYNLYPLMVHLNLFGMSYYGSIEQTIKQLQ